MEEQSYRLLPGSLWMASLLLFWDMEVAVVLGNKRIKTRLGVWIFRIENLLAVCWRSSASSWLLTEGQEQTLERNHGTRRVLL